MFEYQPPAVLNQAAPVQNQWYDILLTTAYVRVYLIAVNVEDVNETLECQVIIDGETIDSTPFAATESTDYNVYLSPDAINRSALLLMGTLPGVEERRPAFVVEGHSVRVRVRKTTAAGAGNLTGIVIFGVLTRG